MKTMKTATLRAILLSPLIVGVQARFSCYGKTVQTSAVKAIHRVEPSVICFETRDMLYRLLPLLHPQEAVQPALMAAA